MKNSLILLALILLSVEGFAQAADKPYIFFILVDDLNDYVYKLNGHPQTETPGMDTIASWGTTFYNAHSPSPKCAPSRTSMLTGKDVYYTQMYNNPGCKPFRDYFTPGDGNDEIFTLPEHLKSNGYYTYGINKTFHCFDSYPDLDSNIVDECDRQLSWNKYSWFDGGEDPAITEYGNSFNEGVKNLSWSRIPDSMEYLNYDYRAIDSALTFIDQYSAGTISTCGNPFFITLGLRKPHGPWYVPEKYFSNDYLSDFYAEPFNYPYNLPVNNFPFNGIVMPPQPDTIYEDFYKLRSLAQQVASFDSTYFGISDEAGLFSPLPEIEAGLSDAEKLIIVNESLRANATIGYLAAIKFMDTQVKRFIDSLQTYPDIFNNCIIIFAGDHGFSLGEKRHWLKSTMWENDLRVPLIIADMRYPAEQKVYSAVSLLDIFPTLCDMVEIPYPEFINGENYLDGKSLQPFLTDPAAHIERPTIASYKTGRNIQCACFPQYSIRTNDFHYIYYTSNNAGDIIECNGDSVYHEEELYEIGNKFETDPNEWNNLINDSSYRPLINYLQQWLPDSVFYLQRTFSVAILNNETNCLLSYDDTLQLSFSIYDTLGAFISPPANYLFRWTNNLTSDTFEGITAEFPLSFLPDTVFENANKIMFYLQMIDTVNNAVAALDIKYFYLNPENSPSISFNLYADSLWVHVEDINITGNYTSIKWDFDDGYTTNVEIPPAHQYASNGTYTITGSLQYGNYDYCTKAYAGTITPIAYNYFKDSANFLLNNMEPYSIIVHEKQATADKQLSLNIFPNPANEFITINCNACYGERLVEIFNQEGQLIFNSLLETKNSFSIETKDLTPGNYFLRIQTDNGAVATSFEIVR